MGQKLAAYNESGSIVAFYDTVDSPAPSTATTIEITDEQWQSCLATPGYTILDGEIVAPLPPTSAQLLASAQAYQSAILTAACASSIVAGFTSSSLGSEYTYPSKVTDQANQVSIAASASGGLLWCATPGGTWALVQHTQEQAQAVQSSFSAWLNQCQQKLVTLNAQVAEAATPVSVSAVVWTNT